MYQTSLLYIYGFKYIHLQTTLTTAKLSNVLETAQVQTTHVKSLVCQLSGTVKNKFVSVQANFIPKSKGLNLNRSDPCFTCMKNTFAFFEI